MSRSIGSEATFSLGSIVGGRRTPFPLAEPSLVIYRLGRQAIYHGLRALGLSRGDEVLMPAYHHGSEVEATLQAGPGCRFYDGTADLEPDEVELEDLLTPRVRALHLTDYLGFPQDGERWRRWCDAKGLFLVEDAAQAWLALDAGAPVGSRGDLAFFCLYKAVGVPDGAAAVCMRPLPAPRSRPASGTTAAAKLLAVDSVQRSSLLTRMVNLRSREAAGIAPVDPAAAFALGDPDAAPSRATVSLVPRLAGDEVRHARHRNYARLLGALREHVPAPFDRLPEGASPFLFPVRAAPKAEFLEHLAKAGIRGVNFWSVPHPTLPAEQARRLDERRSTTVGLPVHQALDDGHLDQVIEAVQGWDGAIAASR